MWYVIVRAAAGVTFGTQHVGCGTSCLVDGPPNKEADKTVNATNGSIEGPRGKPGPSITKASLASPREETNTSHSRIEESAPKKILQPTTFLPELGQKPTPASNKSPYLSENRQLYKSLQNAQSEAVLPKRGAARNDLLGGEISSNPSLPRVSAMGSPETDVFRPSRGA